MGSMFTSTTTNTRNDARWFRELLEQKKELAIRGGIHIKIDVFQPAFMPWFLRDLRTDVVLFRQEADSHEWHRVFYVRSIGDAKAYMSGLLSGLDYRDLQRLEEVQHG